MAQSSKPQPFPSEDSDQAYSRLTNPESRTVAQWISALSAHGGGSHSADLALDLVLHDIVERICEATHASAAAIALRRDGEFVCRATTGENAPGLGITIDQHSGLSGLSLKTGIWQLCIDTRQDPRVDAEASARLGVRSILTVPIVQDELLGLVEIFSREPGAFSERDAEIVQRFSHEIVESIARAEIAQNEPSLPIEPSFAAIENGEPIFRPDSEDEKHDLWTAVLTYIVVALACVLAGLLVRIGWNRVAAKPKARAEAERVAAAQSSPTKAEETTPSESDLQLQPGAPPAEPANSDVVVYENGKVVYPRHRTTPVLKLSPEIAAEYISTRVEPDYPEQARAKRVQGPVVLEALVGDDGSVENVRSISGSAVLAKAAIDAVKQWQFRPFFRNGQPAEFSTHITIVFRLPE